MRIVQLIVFLIFLTALLIFAVFQALLGIFALRAFRYESQMLSD